VERLKPLKQAKCKSGMAEATKTGQLKQEELRLFFNLIL
jgi:3-dehydroquinate synthetase